MNERRVFKSESFSPAFYRHNNLSTAENLIDEFCFSILRYTFTFHRNHQETNRQVQKRPLIIPFFAACSERLSMIER